MVKVEGPARWTTSGWEQTRPGQDDSYFVEKTTARSTTPTLLSSTKKATTGGMRTPFDTTALKLKKKKRFEQAYQAQEEKLRQSYRNMGKRGEEAVQPVMEEWMRRQMILFGGDK
jgi:hypothetical protein